jgi:predicted dehydrogenase
MSDNASNPKSRREFLRNAAATAAAVAAGPAVAKSTVYTIGSPKAVGANERIQVAHVGLGTQGYGAHVRLMKQNAKANNIEQVAVCDLYGRRLRQSGTFLGLPESAWFWDHRKMLENKDIDAVVIATSDNWHAPISIHALEAGKHVYCEKPMCKGVDEAWKVHDAVKRTGLSFQVGSQGCSDPMYYTVRDIVKSGKIGKLVMGQASYNRGDNRIGEWNNYGDNPYKPPHNQASPEATGDNHVDWSTFRRGHGPKAWDPDRFFRWRKYWAYGNGLVGDLMPHKLHPLFIAMNIPTTGSDGFPRRVTSGGVLAVQKINPDTKKPDREVPDFTYMCADFDDFSMIVMSSTVNEQNMRSMLRGNKATILFAADPAQIIPERAFSGEIDAETVPLHGNGEPIPVHEKNWFDSIRSGEPPHANIDLAIRVQTMIGLGELAYRYNESFTWDAAARTSTPDYRKYNVF